MEYILVLFPEVQEYMEYNWFNKECYLLQAMDEQEHFDSAYFIPLFRIEEVEKNPELNLMDD